MHFSRIILEKKEISVENTKLISLISLDFLKENWQKHSASYFLIWRKEGKSESKWGLISKDIFIKTKRNMENSDLIFQIILLWIEYVTENLIMQTIACHCLLPKEWRTSGAHLFVILSNRKNTKELFQTKYE